MELQLEKQTIKTNKLFSKKTFYWLFFLIFLAISTLNLFDHLGHTINDFDEGRHGVSAYEMIKSGNYIVNTYDFHPDYWNLKPPLSFWVVIMGYKLFGFNPFGLRVFSAVFAFLTILITGLYTKHRYGMLSSLISIMVLSTSIQYLFLHGARIGGADSLYILFVTLAIISMLLSDKNKKYLYLTGLSFSLAFLAKSWHAGCIPVILLVYLLFTGEIKKLTVKNWVLLFTTALTPILIWGFVRYLYDGWNFLSKMVTYDLLKRSLNQIEDHHEGPFYYLHWMTYPIYRYWLGLLGLFVLLSFNRRIKSFISEKKSSVIGLLSWIVIPLLLFSIAQTKIDWYMLPVYPPLAILIGVLGGQHIKSGKRWMSYLAILSVIMVYFHYEHLIVKSYLFSPIPDNVQSFLVSLKKDHIDFKNKIIYSSPEWTQDDTLAAKLYDNLNTQLGGIDAYKKDKNSLLLLPNYKLHILQQNSYKIIKEYNGLDLVKHSSKARKKD